MRHCLVWESLGKLLKGKQFRPKNAERNFTQSNNHTIPHSRLFNSKFWTTPIQTPSAFNCFRKQSMQRLYHNCEISCECISFLHRIRSSSQRSLNETIPRVSCVARVSHSDGISQIYPRRTMFLSLLILSAMNTLRVFLNIKTQFTWILTVPPNSLVIYLSVMMASKKSSNIASSLLFRLSMTFLTLLHHRSSIW